MNQNERYAAQLGRVLDQIDALAEHRAETMKELNGRISRLRKEARHWRDLLAGRKGEQQEIDLVAEMLTTAKELNNATDS